MTSEKRASLVTARRGGERATRPQGLHRDDAVVDRAVSNSNDDEHEYEADLEPDTVNQEAVNQAAVNQGALNPEVMDADSGPRAIDGDDPSQLAVVTRGSSPTSAQRDPVGRFLAEVRLYPRLSEDQERELGRAVRERGDPDAARRLVVHNLRLVVAIAHQYRRAWANILDLFQEGSVGLLEAVKRWEPKLGPRFGSYAAYWIRAYVLKFLMTNSRLVHVGNTRAGRKLFFRLERERQKLMTAGFEPTPKLLAAKLDVNEHDLEEVGRHLDSREVSFDPPVSGTADDEGYPLSERIALGQASPEDSAATAEMSEALHHVMDDFVATLTDERERTIWNEHLAAVDPVPLGDIGARFGVSKQRAGQIADSLKKRFRERIVAHMGPEIRADWLGDDS